MCASQQAPGQFGSFVPIPVGFSQRHLFPQAVIFWRPNTPFGVKTAPEPSRRPPAFLIEVTKCRGTIHRETSSQLPLILTCRGSWRDGCAEGGPSRAVRSQPVSTAVFLQYEVINQDQQPLPCALTPARWDTQRPPVGQGLIC